jgi:hypothetical protein
VPCLSYVSRRIRSLDMEDVRTMVDYWWDYNGPWRVQTFFCLYWMCCHATGFFPFPCTPYKHRPHSPTVSATVGLHDPCLQMPTMWRNGRCNLLTPSFCPNELYPATIMWRIITQNRRVKSLHHVTLHDDVFISTITDKKFIRQAFYRKSNLILQAQKCFNNHI